MEPRASSSSASPPGAETGPKVCSTRRCGVRPRPSDRMIASRRSPATFGRSVTTNGSTRPESKNAASAGLPRTSASTASRTASACVGVAVMTASDSSGRRSACVRTSSTTCSTSSRVESTDPGRRGPACRCRRRRRGCTSGRCCGSGRRAQHAGVAVRGEERGQVRVAARGVGAQRDRRQHVGELADGGAGRAARVADDDDLATAGDRGERDLDGQVRGGVDARRGRRCASAGSTCGTSIGLAAMTGRRRRATSGCRTTVSRSEVSRSSTRSANSASACSRCWRSACDDVPDDRAEHRAGQALRRARGRASRTARTAHRARRRRSRRARGPRRGSAR